MGDTFIATKACGSGVAADDPTMERSRSWFSIALGLAAIGLAAWAIAGGHRTIVVIAAIAAVGSVLLAIDLPGELLGSRRDRARLADEATRLEQERAEAEQRALRSAAEAIAAREALAETLRRSAEAEAAAATEAATTAAAAPATGNGESPTDRATGDDPAGGAAAGDDAGGTPAGTGSARTAGVDPLIDADTGLFNHRFFEASLATRIASARRALRPLTIGMAAVVADAASDDPEPVDPAIVTDALIEVFRESDTIARAEDGTYMVLLEDTAESDAVFTFERLRRHIVDGNPNHTTWAGLACYPAHAFEADALMAQARDALIRAMEWRQDRIEVTEQSA